MTVLREGKRRIRDTEYWIQEEVLFPVFCILFSVFSQKAYEYSRLSLLSF